MNSLNFNTLRPSVFNFKTMGYTCDILESAIVRYKQIITVHLRKVRSRINRDTDNKWRSSDYNNGHLDIFKVDLKKPCEKMPHQEMDESCKSYLLSLIINQRSFLFFFR